MTRAEATQLATRILATFNGPPLADWEDELEPLDHGRAGTAYVRLRREHEQKWLSLALYLATYRALHTIDASNAPKKCGWCDDMGWVETARHTARGQVYTGWEPCTHCPEGRAREVSETWTKSPARTFVVASEAARLIDANHMRYNPPKPPPKDDAA